MVYNINIFNWKSGDLLKIINAHNNDILFITRLKSRLFISGGSDLSIKLWDWRINESLVK